MSDFDTLHAKYLRLSKGDHELYRAGQKITGDVKRECFQRFTGLGRAIYDLSVYWNRLAGSTPRCAESLEQRIAAIADETLSEEEIRQQIALIDTKIEQKLAALLAQMS